MDGGGGKTFDLDLTYMNFSVFLSNISAATLSSVIFVRYLAYISTYFKVFMQCMEKLFKFQCHQVLFFFVISILMNTYV